MVALVIVVFSVVIIAIMVVRNGQKDDEDGLNDENGNTIRVKNEVYDELGYLEEGESYLDDIEITELNIICVNFSLHWIDEEAMSVMHENTPDEFSLEVEPPENSSFLNSPFNKVTSGTGYINISFKLSINVEHSNNIGTWGFNVTCVDAGDQIRKVGLPIHYVDNGNSWELSVTVTYLKEKD